MGCGTSILKLNLSSLLGAIRAELEYHLTEQEWDKIKRAIEILFPFFLATTELQKSSTCMLSRASLYANRLNDGLSQFDDTILCVSAMRAKLKKYLGDLAESSLLASYLDPCTFEYLDRDTRKKAASKIKVLLPAPTQTTSSSKGCVESVTADSFAALMVQESSSTILDPLFKGYPELRAYELASKPGLSGNPLAWWKENESALPLLAAIAKDNLSTLASSAPSERVFSGAGLLVTDLRNKLAPDTIEACVLGHYLNKYLQH